MKWLFLLRRESALAGDSTFYDFVPYRYGPFSFEAYQGLGALAREGLVQWPALAIPEDRIGQAWAIEAGLPTQTRRATCEILASYGALPTSQLRELVYARYPWYASRSELRPTLGMPRQAPPAVYTIGYEGKSIDRFLDQLLQSGIKVLIDVRNNAFSYKYGFSGKTLRQLAGRIGVTYLHLPELGIPSGLRRDIGAPAARQQLLDRYERDMLPHQEQAVQRVASLLEQQASALLCFEADASCCHRGRLASRLAAHTDLPLLHL